MHELTQHEPDNEHELPPLILGLRNLDSFNKRVRLI